VAGLSVGFNGYLASKCDLNTILDHASVQSDKICPAYCSCPPAPDELAVFDLCLIYKYVTGYCPAKQSLNTNKFCKGAEVCFAKAALQRANLYRMAALGRPPLKCQHCSFSSVLRSCMSSAYSVFEGWKGINVYLENYDFGTDRGL
jgi:hypothetical protein